MINLLPTKGREMVRADYFRRVITTFLFLAAIAFLLGNILLILLAWRLQVEANGLTKLREAEESKTDRAALITAKKLLTQTKERLVVLGGLGLPSASPGDLIEKVLTSKTAGVKIFTINYTTGTNQAGVITLTGQASTRGAFLKWIDNLKAGGVFSSVESPVSNIIKERGSDFAVTLIVK